MPDFDIIVIGGGHNGLTAAAYFAKAGFKTALVEKNDLVGGGAVTKQLMVPGVLHDLHSTLHVTILGSPMIANDELGLISRFGLKYIYPEVLLSAPFKDGSNLVWTKNVEQTAKSIERISKHDANSYRKFVEWSKPILNASLAATFEPPAPFAAAIAEMESTPEGREMLQLSYMSLVNLANEWFEDDRLKAVLIKVPAEWLLASPTVQGSAMLMVGDVASIHTIGWATPQGGSGKLSEALEACIKAYGGTVFTNTLATKIIVKDGKAVGVETQNGKILNAKKAVVCDLNIKQIPKMVGEDNLDPSFVTAVNRLTHSDSSMLSHWVLSDYPRYTANEIINRSYGVVLTPSMDEVIHAYDLIRVGKPSTGTPWITCATLTDPTRAPQGKHTLFLWHAEPYDLSDGGAGAWDRIKDDLSWQMLENIRQYAPNMTKDKVLGLYTHSPVDYEKWNPSFMKGDPYHIAGLVGQTGSLRPLPGYGDFRLPIENLFLCGPSTHVGGGVTGQARAAAKAIIGYLGVDFNRALEAHPIVS